MLDVCHAGQGWVRCEICTLEGEREREREIGDTLIPGCGHCTGDCQVWSMGAVRRKW